MHYDALQKILLYIANIRNQAFGPVWKGPGYEAVLIFIVAEVGQRARVS